jgi:hypothetical protein
MEQSRHIFILCNRHLRRQHKAVFLDLDIRILLLFIYSQYIDYITSFQVRLMNMTVEHWCNNNNNNNNNN